MCSSSTVSPDLLTSAVHHLYYTHACDRVIQKAQWSSGNVRIDRAAIDKLVISVADRSSIGFNGLSLPCFWETLVLLLIFYDLRDADNEIGKQS